ncbi:MAG: hypothetical protein AB1714_24450 [Acidobacteriota bacterium]
MRRALWPVLVLSWLLSGCGQPPERFLANAVRVTVFEIKPGANILTFEVSGAVLPEHETELRTPLSGSVHWEHPGRGFRKGECVATIRSPELEARREAMKQRLAFAEDRLKQQREAQSFGLISIRDLREYEARLAEAQAELRLVEIQLARACVRMPVDGEIVWRTDVADGGEVREGDPLCRLAQVDRWKFEGYCESEEWRRMENCERWNLTAVGHAPPIPAALGRATPDETIPGRFKVMATFLPPAGLAPGARAVLSAEKSTASPSVCVPPDCVIYVNRQPHVFLIKRRSFFSKYGSVVLQPVALGEETSQWVAILSGLSPGDAVARSALDRLAPGTFVKIETAQP